MAQSVIERGRVAVADVTVRAPDSDRNFYHYCLPLTD